MPTTPIFHTHSLDVKTTKNEITYCFDNGIYPGSRSPVFLIHDKIMSKQRNYKIISLYRDPIERNISAFFDAFELYVGFKPEAYTGSLEHLETLFHKHLPYTYPLKWFDDNFFYDTQIDVYKYPFNAQLGHTVIQQDGKAILIMNCYLDDSLKEKLICEFCGIPNFELTNTNITENRSSGNLYKKFKAFIRFDEAYLLKCYNSKYAKHFFTEAERENAIEKWLKPE